MRPDAEIAELDSAAAVAAKAEEIYGAPLTSTGVVHVTSVWRRRTAYLTLAIGPRTPRSAHDALVLNPPISLAPFLKIAKWRHGIRFAKL